MDEKVTFGLPRNVAYGLIYLFSFVTGLIFFFSEKEDEEVRYHAVQSVILGVVLCILSVIFTFIPFIGWIGTSAVGLVVVATAILGFMGRPLDIPVISDKARAFAKK